jgi:hypothetical protein
MVINKGIDVNLKNKDGQTALHKGLYKLKKLKINKNNLF